jgi:hypothetical protein
VVLGCGLFIGAIFGTSGPLAAEESPAAASLCETIEESAAKHGLSAASFTRLMWKESRLKANAVSPVGAQGIAQFMPKTAKARGLANPFDPAQAIPASASYLKELKDSLGNFGLAVAAYNAGEGRVSQWLAGRSSLPTETQNYVAFITGHSAHSWRSAGDAGLSAKHSAGCAEVATALAKPGGGSAVTTPTKKRAAAEPAPQKKRSKARSTR